MATYKFVLSKSSIHTSGFIVDKDDRRCQPASGQYIMDGDLFELPPGEYTYVFGSRGEEADYTIKIVDADSNRTRSGPESHEASKRHDTFKFRV